MKTKCGAVFSGYAAMVFCTIQIYVVRKQLEVKPCKAQMQKGKKESRVRRQYAELKSGRTMSSKGKCVYYPKWERNPGYKQC